MKEKLLPLCLSIQERIFFHAGTSERQISEPQTSLETLPCRKLRVKKLEQPTCAEKGLGRSVACRNMSEGFLNFS